MDRTDRFKRILARVPEWLISGVKPWNGDSKKTSFLINVKKKKTESIDIPSTEFLRKLFERFSEDAMEAITVSEEESRRLCHVRVGTDNILAGLLLGAHENNIAAKVLESMGINLKDLYAEADKIAGRLAYVPIMEDHVKKITIDIPFSETALHSLEFSYQEARKLGHNYIGSGHLLLGLVSDEVCLASLVLAKLGANASNIRAEVIRKFEENKNETILEGTSYLPSDEDVSKLDEELSELQKRQSQIIKEMTEAFDARQYKTLITLELFLTLL